MRFEHPARPGPCVRLGYGLNLHPAEHARDPVAGVLDGLRRIAVPLRQRFPEAGGAFGIGAYLPARAALALERDAGRERDEWLAILREEELDPFTANAFPFARFHEPGLKERVFEPGWADPERLAYTLAVARLAARARAQRGGSRELEHLSISTHAGRFGAADPGQLAELAEAFLRAALELGRLEEETGERVVLAIEPEPRSSANDTSELARLHELVRARARGPGQAERVQRHLGTCLDACHAAVEFEEPEEAFARATAQGTALGKLQFSSALSLSDPDRRSEARAHLLALDEPVYLHQVTGRRGGELARALDLPELARLWQRGAPAWRACEEWRCHFHVPVDRTSFEGGLATTRSQAERILDAALAAPERWGTRELHVEVETYTWNLLARQASDEELVGGLERELRHVWTRLRAAGWRPVDTGLP